MLSSLRTISVFTLTLSVISLCACSVQGGNAQEKQQTILTMQKKAIRKLYQEKPGAKVELRRAYGYAVFSNANVNIIFASFSGGYGVARNNRTHQKTFMKMSGAGVGLGIGAKDYRIIMLFKTKRAYQQFVHTGWVFGAQADATAKASHKGGSTDGELNTSVVKTYVLVQSGLALQATLQGTKYWPYAELNRPQKTSLNHDD